jgi:pilus assembly protein CpaE
MAQRSLTVAVISPEARIRELIASSVEENPHVAALWTLADYPGPLELARIREARSGCVVFLDFSDPVRAARVAAELDQHYPMAATVAVQAGSSPQDLIGLMQLGIREVITIPVSPEEVNEALQRACRKLSRVTESPEQFADIHTFLPARPGSGATTIAVHSAAAAARLSAEPVLLVDFDLRLGMTSFLLKLHCQNSILDALALSGQLESTLWDQMVSHRDGLDILGSAPMEFDRRFPEAGAVGVLDFASRRYRNICVDLPGEMRQHELDTLERSKNIFLVCTSEVGTLHMAKRKAEMLQSLGIQNRVSVILNRVQSRGSMEIRDIEQVLRLPVLHTLPAADNEIVAATANAVALEGNSPISTAMENLARRMTGVAQSAQPAVQKTKPRRLIDFFSVTPIREVGRTR